MKNFTLLMLLLATVTLVSCKKDNEEKQQKNILGKWYFKTVVEKEIESGVTTYEETEDDFTTADFIEFKSDGKVTSTQGGYSFVGTYKINENSRLILIDEDGDTEEYEIKKLNSTELVLYMEDIDSPTAKETFEMTLRK